ncbi:MAG: hypothetical protein JKX83_10970 [Pseudomonadales bacterium]|nr:hypothetical protein [Pseudomonadales bacterium]
MFIAIKWQDIEGVFALTRAGMVSKAQDSHYRIQLSGNSAKSVYEAMKVTPVTR